ncbi:guanylate-binding protein 5-like [Mercenaria mercenaria]|uniref:guanylate-binding protein 5-like n=1 Tax=Mercenaria mercenaria TaxID=6596 RepID=UPI00234EE10C|nr:guanylate-binding protein 5-like [Mercenaria mercenaria]
MEDIQRLMLLYVVAMAHQEVFQQQFNIHQFIRDLGGEEEPEHVASDLISSWMSLEEKILEPSRNSSACQLNCMVEYSRRSVIASGNSTPGTRNPCIQASISVEIRQNLKFVRIYKFTQFARLRFMDSPMCEEALKSDTPFTSSLEHWRAALYTRREFRVEEIPTARKNVFRGSDFLESDVGKYKSESDKAKRKETPESIMSTQRMLGTPRYSDVDTFPPSTEMNEFLRYQFPEGVVGKYKSESKTAYGKEKSESFMSTRHMLGTSRYSDVDRFRPSTEFTRTSFLSSTKDTQDTASSEWDETHCDWSTSIFEEPKCLIAIDTEGKLTIKEDVLTQIEAIKEALNIVAIAGVCRTGKSYLMNRIAGRKKGFSVGNTVKSHTKGIWVLCMKHPTQTGQVLALLDTAGLSDAESTRSGNDIQIFCLTVLLCSTLIYNMVGVLNKDTLEKITFISALADNIETFNDIGIGSGKKIDTVRLVTPKLILCVRDFFLPFDNNDTPDEYFEKCLSSTGESNKSTMCINKFFSNRKCFTICQPAMGEQLVQLEHFKDHKLPENFLQDVEKLKKCVYSSAPKRLLMNRTVDGSMFAAILRSYVQALRKGHVLNVEDAYTQAASQHNQMVLNKVKESIQSDIIDIHLPVPKKEDLQRMLFKVQKKALRMFRNGAFPYEASIGEENIEEEVLAIWTEVRSDNKRCIQDICFDKLSSLYSIYMDSENMYKTEGGYKNFKSGLHVIEDVFFRIMKEYDYDELMEAVKRFKEKKKHVMMEIYQTDTELTQRRKIDQMRKEMDKKLTIQLDQLRVEKENHRYLIEEESRRRAEMERTLRQKYLEFEKEKKNFMQTFEYNQYQDLHAIEQDIEDRLQKRYEKEHRRHKQEQEKRLKEERDKMEKFYADQTETMRKAMKRNRCSIS